MVLSVYLLLWCLRVAIVVWRSDFNKGDRKIMLANDHFVGRREMAGVELPGILVSFGSLDSSLVDATDCTDPG